MVSFLFSIIIACLLVTLNTGQLTGSINSAKADLQAKARNITSQITSDVRQTISWDIANNSPSGSYIKFRLVQGWDAVNKTFSLLDAGGYEHYAVYSYDSATKTITYTTYLFKSGLQSNVKTVTFDNIVAVPFRNRDLTDLTQNELLNNRRITVIISAQTQVRGSLDINATLQEEVKIRNG